MILSNLPKPPVKKRLYRAVLLPDRHPTPDFFICDILDAAPKDDMASMEHPIFSLSTKRDTKVRRYEHNNNLIQIAPSVLGLATIHDKDILIYCISQLIAKINNGETPSRTVRLKAHDLLISTNRQTSGRGYELLKDAFERLAGTRITTDIRTNGERVISGFGLLDSWKIVVKDQKTERMIEVQATLSEWMYNSILGKEVLTISRDYFRLRKPMERRIYEIARKHCGSQREWRIDIETLYKKCGSSTTLRYFKFALNDIIKEQHLPDYTLALNDNKVIIQNRKAYGLRTTKNDDETLPQLKVDTIQKARKIAAGYDIYALEREWRDWWYTSGKPPLKSPDGAFIGFCKKRYGKAASASGDLFDY